MASKSNSPAKWKKANAHLRLNKHLAERWSCLFSTLTSILQLVGIAATVLQGMHWPSSFGNTSSGIPSYPLAGRSVPAGLWVMLRLACIILCDSNSGF
jgi:hypothetical protein